jgi:hypothetical protein
MPPKKEIRPPKANVGAKRANKSPPRGNRVPPKATLLVQVVQRRGGISSNMWASNPK